MQLLNQTVGLMVEPSYCSTHGFNLPVSGSCNQFVDDSMHCELPCFYMQLANGMQIGNGSWGCTHDSIMLVYPTMMVAFQNVATNWCYHRLGAVTEQRLGIKCT